MPLITIEANQPGQVPIAGTDAVRSAGFTAGNVPDGVPLLGTRRRGARPSLTVLVEVAPGDVRKFRREDAIAYGLIPADEQANQ